MYQKSEKFSRNQSNDIVSEKHCVEFYSNIYTISACNRAIHSIAIDVPIPCGNCYYKPKIQTGKKRVTMENASDINDSR